MSNHYCLYASKRKSKSLGGEEEGEVEREIISSRLPVEHRAQSGLQLRSHDPEIMTCAKIKSQMLNQLSYPGTPKF